MKLLHQENLQTLGCPTEVVENLPMRARHMGYVIVLACSTGFILAQAGCSETQPKQKTQYTVEDIIKYAKDRRQVTDDMMKIARMYFQYEIDHMGRPPGKLNDLEEYLATDSRAYQGIKEGRFIVIWNASTKNQPAGQAETVRIYEAKEDAYGVRIVFTADGVNHTMDTAEFNAAPKAKTR